MIKVGKQLIRHLDLELEVQAALWVYFDETEVWRLVLASPMVNTAGPKWLYHRIHMVLLDVLRTRKIGLPNITVRDSEHPMIQALRLTFGTIPKISGIRFSGYASNGYFIDDAYIYFLT